MNNYILKIPTFFYIKRKSVIRGLICRFRGISGTGGCRSKGAKERKGRNCRELGFAPRLVWFQSLRMSLGASGFYANIL